MGPETVLLWAAIGVCCLLAILFVTRPLYRHEKRLSPLIAGCVVLIVGISLGLYAYQGRPDIPSVSGDAAEPPDIESMVESLAARLKEEPDDIEGWKMLGRSYMTLQDFPAAVSAYERAVELEGSQQAQTLVDLGTAMLARDQSRIEGRTSALFESALAIDPMNPEALFYGGIAALNRGSTDLAAQRWEKLLSLNPPDSIRTVLEERIAEWRGVAPPPGQPAVGQGGAVVNVQVAIAAGLTAELPPDASVFVVARDPEQPSPPIAVARRQLLELPVTVSLGDADSMIPGRNLSAFSRVELIARVSISGEPVAQSGDWYASAIVEPARERDVSLEISQQVP